jgi:DNA repair exonuclease SbcCD ATPase subunit
VSQPNATQMKRINKIAMMALAPEWNGEVENAVSALRKIFNKSNLKATDLEIVPAGSHLDGGSHNNAAMESLQSDIADLMNRLNAAHCEIANLRAARTYGFPDQRVQADSRDASNAKAEANALRAKVAKLEATLAKTMAESDESNRAREEADARADAARRENDELRAALQEATAELREAQRVADVRRDAAANNGRVDAAGAATDNPTSGVEAHEHHAETVENPTCTHPSDDVASDRQQGWNPRFDAKAVGLYWRAVHAINADLETGLITKKQASGRKASALRDYKSRATLGSRARNARRAA